MVRLLVRKPLERPGVGAAPGTLTYVGAYDNRKSQISAYCYNQEELGYVEGWEEIEQLNREGKVLWVNLDGINGVDEVQRISQAFGLHILTQEEILNTDQRPKVEAYKEYVFLPVKMLYPHGAGEQFVVEHLSLVLGAGFVLSFQEQGRDVFGPLRSRLEDQDSRLRNRGADYLFYALFDAVTSHYFHYLDTLEDKLSALEAAIYQKQESVQLKEIQQLQSDLVIFLRYVNPLREMVHFFLRMEESYIDERGQLFFRDLADDVTMIRERTESSRDILRNLRDLYLALVNQKMNEVMKTLTIIATIFIPLTFLSGIYGMNFQHMPELGWKNGYFYLLGIMGSILVSMIIYFRRKQWI